MEKILDSLLEALAQGDITAIFAVLAIAVIFNIANIFRYLESRKRTRIDIIQESLNSSLVNGNTKYFLERLLEQVYFESATGLYLNKEVRESLIELHKSANGELNFGHFKRAVPFLKFKNNLLHIKIDWISLVGAIFSLALGIFCITFGLLLFIHPVLNAVGITQLFSVYASGLFFSSFGLIMLWQALPVLSAKYVKNLMEEIHNKSIHPNNNASAD